MMKNCIIYETLEDVQSMRVEKTGNGLMRLTGTFGVCGVKNNNHRIYEKENYSKMVKILQERIETEGCPGELEHPDSMNINLANISHKIDSISIDENGVVSGTITLLNTPNGKIAQAIVEGGIPLFISSRARGTVDKNGKVTLEELKTYDLVGTPGFSQAKMHLTEGRVAECLNESLFYITDIDTQEININENKEEEMEKFKKKIDLLENRIIELEGELRESRRDQISERKIGNMIREQIDRNLSRTNKGSSRDLGEIKKWISSEYSDLVQEWVESNIKGQVKSTKDEIYNSIVEKFSPAVQNWVTNEYSKEVQNWVTNEYSKEVQNWVTNEYSKEVQNWVTNECMKEVQNWIVNECMKEVQNWIVNECMKEVQNWIVNEYSQGVQNWVIDELTPVIDKWTKNQISESKKASLSSIDETLQMLEESAKKPKYGKREILREEANTEPRYIREMPEESRIKWNMASDSVKESIKRKAKVCNLVNEEAIENFWKNVSFEEKKTSVGIMEGLETIQDDRERAIRAQIRRMNNRY